MRLDWIFLPREKPCAQFYIIIMIMILIMIVIMIVIVILTNCNMRQVWEFRLEMSVKVLQRVHKPQDSEHEETLRLNFLAVKHKRNPTTSKISLKDYDSWHPTTTQFSEVSFSFFYSKHCDFCELFIELERPRSCLCWCKYFFHLRLHVTIMTDPALKW